MKRYHCKTCNRVVRCRRLPDDVKPNLHEKPEPGHALLATCRHHGPLASRAKVNDRVRVISRIGSTRKMSASAAKSKSKKG